MIDFIKIKVQNPDIPAIRCNPLLEWNQLTNEGTGEVKEYNVVYNGLTFRITVNKYLDISGSLHKHWNTINGSGLQNYNIFTFPDLSTTIQTLCQTFNLSPDQCKLENIEYGVNINSPIPVNSILQSAINHRLQPFSREYSEKKRFRECIHRQYIIKIYNKGLQYDQPSQLLRFEVKVIKMEFLKNIGISSISDILDIQKLSGLGRDLFENFNEILFFGTDIPLDKLPDRERIVLSEGRNPQYWVDLKNSNRNNYNQRRKRFIELVRKYSTFDISENIGNIITGKWNELQNCTSKTIHNLTGVQNSQTIHNLTGGENPNYTQLDHSSIGSNCVNLDMNVQGSKPGIFDTEKQNEPLAGVEVDSQGRKWSIIHFIPVYSKTGELLEFLDLGTGQRKKAA